MTDEELVARLRASRAVWLDGCSIPTEDETEAASRIEALTEQLTEARAGLLEIHRIVPLHPAGDIALATLKKLKDESNG